MAQESVLRYEGWAVDLRRRRLTRQGRAVRLQPQPFALLALLISRAGETVTRAELQAALWPRDTHVAFDTGLNTAIRKLRRALGDSAAHANIIQTVPGVGYRFIALPAPLAITESTAPAAASAAPATAPPGTVTAGTRTFPHRLARIAAVVLASIVTVPAMAPPGAWVATWRAHADAARQRSAAHDLSGARAEFAVAIAAGADDETVFVDAACVLAALKQPADALGVIERGLARRPRSVVLHANRGLYLHAVGRYDEELAALTAAVAMDPRSPDAQFHLGLGFARRRDYDASLAALQRAVDLSGGAPRYLSWLGRIAADAGHRDRAESVLHTLQQHSTAAPVPEALINAVAYHLAAAARS